MAHSYLALSAISAPRAMWLSLSPVRPSGLTTDPFCRCPYGLRIVLPPPPSAPRLFVIARGRQRGRDLVVRRRERHRERDSLGAARARLERLGHEARPLGARIVRGR
eukprot:scaffold1774_cov121-Isochrysis_galbana.AAC.7